MLGREEAVPGRFGDCDRLRPRFGDGVSGEAGPSGGDRMASASSVTFFFTGVFFFLEKPPFRLLSARSRFLSSSLARAFARRRSSRWPIRFSSLRASFAASLRASRSPTVSLLASCVSSSVDSYSDSSSSSLSDSIQFLRFASSAIRSMSSFSPIHWSSDNRSGSS